MFQQLLSVAQYCHQRHIVLQDLKPENIFLDGEISVKLANFGFSGEFTEEKQYILWHHLLYGPRDLAAQIL